MTIPPVSIEPDDRVMSAEDSPPRPARVSFKRLLLGMLAGLISAGAVAAASAQDRPAGPITLIVPFSAGGPTDMVARVIAAQMSKMLGRQIVVETTAGSGGTAATMRAMRAPADGNTIELGTMGTHASAVALYPDLPYHPVTDFEPIGLVADMPVAVFARKDLPARSLKELVSYARREPGRLTMAYGGVSSVSFTACLLLNSMLGLKPTTVAYNGTRPAMSALAAGQIDYLCNPVANGVVEFGRGSVKALAVASAAESPVLPGVPTAREAGFAGFEVTAWTALFAPKGTPQPILDRLTGALDQALSDAATRKRLIELGCNIPEVPRRGQQALTSLLKREIERWKMTLGALAPPPGLHAESVLRAVN